MTTQHERVELLMDEHAENAKDREVLVNIADLLVRSLAQLEHIRKLLEQPSESRSSCAVKTSTRGQDLEVKSYADGMLEEAAADAINVYARGLRKLVELQNNQWQEVVEA